MSLPSRIHVFPTHISFSILSLNPSPHKTLTQKSQISGFFFLYLISSSYSRQTGSRLRFQSRRTILVDRLRKAYGSECASLGLWNAKWILSVRKVLTDSSSHTVTQSPHYSFLKLWRTLPCNWTQALPPFSSLSTLFFPKTSLISQQILVTMY